MKLYICLFLIFLNVLCLFGESIIVSGEVSGIWDTDTVIVTGDIILPEGSSLEIPHGTNVQFEPGTSFQINGNLDAQGLHNSKINFEGSDKTSLAQYLWFTDNNFGIRGLYPGTKDDKDSYFSPRFSFEGKVHSNSDIWLQHRISDINDDWLESYAGPGFWPAFLDKVTSGGNFTGNIVYPNDYDPEDILGKELLSDIFLIDAAYEPYGYNWRSEFQAQVPRIELPRSATELRNGCDTWLNQDGAYVVIRARLEGDVMYWQGGSIENVDENTVILENVYDPWNGNHPGEAPDTIEAITWGMIEEARNKYLINPQDSSHIRSDDSYLSPWVYNYVEWGELRETPLPDDGGIFVDCELWIEGYVGDYEESIEKRVTIGASSNIRITSDIWYGCDELEPVIKFFDESDRFRQDMDLDTWLFNDNQSALGLVSEEKIILAYTPQNYGVHINHYGTTQQDEGLTIFAALAALGTDDNDDENTFDDGMITFEMWHPPANEPVWDESFSHSIGSSDYWVSFYPVDLDSDGDVDLMLDWNNPRDLQHLYYYDPTQSIAPNWLMHPSLIGSLTDSIWTQSYFQPAHYLYQSWEWKDNWESDYDVFVPNRKNRGTLHICGSIVQRIRGHIRRTPFDPTEGNHNDNTEGYYENYGDGVQNGYASDYIHDHRFDGSLNNYISLPYYPEVKSSANWRGLAFGGSGESLLGFCEITDILVSQDSLENGAIKFHNSNGVKIENTQIHDCTVYGAEEKGLFYAQNSFFTMQNSIIHTNFLPISTLQGNLHQTALIYCDNASPVITGSVFHSQAMDVNFFGYFTNNSSPSFYNSIFTDEMDVIGRRKFYLEDDSSNPLFAYNIIKEGETSFLGPGSGEAYDWENLYIENLDVDPLYTQVPDFDLHSYDFRVQEGSPCIDEGTSDVEGIELLPWDMDNNTRIFDGNGDGVAVIDLGPYEYGSQPFTSISEYESLPDKPVFRSSNYPNPFNPITNISFELIKADKVALTIYNVKGQLVKTLINDEQMDSGCHSIVWNGKNAMGDDAGSGVYFYRLVSGENILNNKMVLMK